MAPERPDWKHWSEFPSVHLAEAVALSCNIEPKSIPNNELNDPKDAKHRKKLDVANAHWLNGTLPHAEGHLSDVPGNPYRYVTLPEFAAWSRSLTYPWKLPKKFPGLPKASSLPHVTVPISIAPVGSNFVINMPKGRFIAEPLEDAAPPPPPANAPMKAVNWRDWGHRTESELWEAVAVSLDISPDGWIFEDARERFPDAFKAKLAASVKYLGRDKLPIVKAASWCHEDGRRAVAKQMMVGPPPKAMCIVKLTAFADFADELGWKPPRLFPRLPQSMGTSDRERDARNLKLANEKRRGDASSLRDAVADLDRQHPKWSHAEIARALTAQKIGHYKSGKPYSARHIGFVRNELRIAHRRFGRKSPV